MSLKRKLRFFLLIIVIAACFNIVKLVPSIGAEGLIEQSRYPVVYVFPRNVSASLGEVFTISVIGFNFTDKKIQDPDNPGTSVWVGNLGGFDIQFTWDPEVLQYVNHTVTVSAQDYPAPNPPSPYGGALNQPFLEIKNIVNESGGIPFADPQTRAWFSYASMDPAEPFNGNCTFFTMTFRVKNDKKACVLEFVPGETGDFPQLSVSSTILSIYRKVYNGYYRSMSVPTADFTYQPSVAVLNRTTEFTALVSENVSNIALYMWDFGDGVQQNTTAPIITHVYNSTGDKTAALKVVDVDGFESSWSSKTLAVIAFRDLKVSEVRFPAPKIKITPQTLLTLNTIIENLGGSNENCTVYAYYNTTKVDPADPEAAGWNLINQTNILLSKATSRTLTFSLNTTLLAVNSSYYAFAKVTGIPSGYERNTTDNSRLSDKLIFVTNVDIHEISIVNFDCVWQIGAVLRFPPLIEGEDATFRLTLANLGAVPDTANITLYVDGDSVEDRSISLLWGEQKEVPSWGESIAAGYHNLTIVVKAADFSTSDTIWLRVVKPPQLQINIAPSEPIVNQTTTLDSSASVHQDPEANITMWTWKLYAPGVSTEENPTATINGEIVSYNFTIAGNWTIVLDIMDSPYGLKFDTKRSGTNAYRKQVTMSVAESGLQQGGGIPTEYIIAFTLIIVAMVAAVFVFYRRRRLGAKVGESQTEAA